MPSKSIRIVGCALWGTNLASISACTLCYIYLSYYVYRVSENIMLSELVLFAPMLLPVLLVLQINRLSQRYTPRNLMFVGNLLGLACSALTFLFLPHVPYLASLGVVFIGALDSVQRVSRIVAVKKYFSLDQIKLTVPLTLTAQFIAGGLAGGLLSAFKERISPEHVLLLTCLLFAVAALCALALPSIKHVTTSPHHQEAPPSPFRQFASLLTQHPELQRHFIAFVLLITFFQGFFNVSRVALPAHQLGLPASYVGLLQLVNSGAALIGALLFYWASRKSTTFAVQPLRALSAIAMVGACAVPNVVVSYASYFLYIFFFELVFFKIQADIVAACPAESMPLLATVQYAAVYAGMMLTILIGAFLVDKVGLMQAAALFVLVYFVSDGFAQARLRKTRPSL
jgi:MFS family permease